MSPTRQALPYQRARKTMVQEQLIDQHIHDQRVLDVMGEVPRHAFVDEALAGLAYSWAALPIGQGQTLSQPYIVARMTEALAQTGREEVLEIGTGSGYQTAVLAGLCRWVFTIERIAVLADLARQRLRHLGLFTVSYHLGDGSLGWPEPRTFDRILVAAGTPVIPENLTNQLAIGGSLLIPEGNAQTQHLIRLTRTGEETLQREVLEVCRFVPLVGEQGWREVAKPARLEALFGGTVPRTPLDRLPNLPVRQGDRF